MTFVLPAPAKINLHLRVTGRLGNGLHTLDTSFVFLDVADALTFSPCKDLQVTCSDARLDGPSNLVHKVLSALHQRHGVEAGLRVHIDKNLPSEAGLGGGSSDAATAILAANRFWGLDLGRAELISFASPFGADIPCFLYGRASSASGVGDVLHDYPHPLPVKAVLLAWPGVGLSTSQVFSHFDAMHPSVSLTHQEGVDTMRGACASLGINDLEASACAMSREVTELLRYLRDHSPQAWMSGSGSACVALMEDTGQASMMARQLMAAGLASWVHTGHMVPVHPVQMGNENWGVAKR